MIPYSKIEYRVDLKTGDIYFCILGIQNSGHFTLNPYTVCRSLIEADVYSLNVLYQNALEECSKNNRVVKVMHRRVLGVYDSVHVKDILTEMKHIRAKYPEEFV